MKYSLRKSFSFRRRKNRHHDDDDHPNTRIDQNICSNSNSNLVKGNQSKKFSRRRRCSSSSPPPPPPSLSSSTTTAAANKTKSKASKQLYNNHIDDDDDADGDDDPFSSSNNTRMRPLDKLTYQIRKSFRNTLTRQRPRLESNNSNKRLISTTNDENRPVNPIVTPVSTGLTSPIISLTETVLSDEKEKSKAVTKRRKAPLAPTHINQSVSLPNPDCSSLRASDHLESGYVSASNETDPDLTTKKNKLNRSFRTRLSFLLKKRHAKQQIPNSIDENPDPIDTHEINTKKQTLGQRFDTLRRSFQFGNRNSPSKGKRYLLSNE